MRIIPNLAVAGFRSFGKDLQYFDNFEKVNLFIGRNNAGKSNVLRLIHTVYPHSHSPKGFGVNPLDAHLPDRPQLRIGVGEVLENDEHYGLLLRDDHPALGKLVDSERLRVRQYVGEVLGEKRRLDETNLAWLIFNPPNRETISENYLKAFSTLDDNEIYNLWRSLTGYDRGGNRKNDWIPDSIRALQPRFLDTSVAMIPAIRRVGEKGSISDEFDGTGIIERLAKLQNPSVYSQEDKQRFIAVRDFLRKVMDDETAEIEVPYERDTLLVHMDGKSLPLEALGSGIHEVIILAAAATVLTDSVVCIEEPELHLNPILQKKLVRYLNANTSNQYFITTHSPALMDTPGIEIYHIMLEGRASKVARVTSDAKRSSVCEDLGYHPSDLLQANCVIWVEGPSDRIYVNFWIKALSSELVEGVHYMIMFYGGRLSSHLSYSEEAQAVEDFISLRRLNRRGVIIFDSDRPSAHARINDTKQRLKAEFDAGPGHAWVTEGREIENYIPIDQLKDALAKVAPQSTPMSTFGKFENVLKVKSKRGNESQAAKVETAKEVVAKGLVDWSIYNLRNEVEKLVNFIVSSNPKLEAK